MLTSGIGVFFSGAELDLVRPSGYLSLRAPSSSSVKAENVSRASTKRKIV